MPSDPLKNIQRAERLLDFIASLRYEVEEWRQNVLFVETEPPETVLLLDEMAKNIRALLDSVLTLDEEQK